jgi:hypothetical protein
MSLRRVLATTLVSSLLAMAGVLTASPADAAIKGASKCVTEGGGVVECVTIDSNTVDKWNTVYSRSFTNDELGVPVPMKCSESSSSSFSVTVSVSIKAEFKAWVFSKVEASVGTDLTWSWSASGTSTIGPVSVPPDWKYTCKFGTSTYTVNGHTTRYYANGAVKTTYWTFSAPEEEKSWRWSKVKVG